MDNLGSVHFTMGNMKNALNAFEKAISLDESYIPQKYSDTLNRLAKVNPEIRKATTHEEIEMPVMNAPFVIPPAIFVLNYLMIGIGIIAIIILGVMGVIKKRPVKKEQG